MNDLKEFVKSLSRQELFNMLLTMKMAGDDKETTKIVTDEMARRKESEDE